MNNAIIFKNPLTGLPLSVTGGSFFACPNNPFYFKVNLMAEVERPCDAYLPIQDYAIPEDTAALTAIFEKIFEGGKDVYVGCFGGIGRTGLFMASLAKYLGHDNPVALVRQFYNPHACETEEQRSFAENFPVRKLPLHASAPPPSSKL